MRNPYIREIPKYSWYLRQGRYVRYMAREVTSLFIGIHAFLLVCGLGALSEGEAAYNQFLAVLGSPFYVGLLVVTLVFAVYHSVAWFSVTPQAMPVQVGEDFMPGWITIGVHYGIWAVATVLVLFLAGVF
uniref:Fumarate reductase subunit C n=1 Tax=Candidatus Kentrum sp. DK TaxID=2126562 RepID=A0A450TCZ6_9GAMM|nr:MAG: fumarate reductase subunit C [Candidatus Kentron sp. DK]